jgi:Ca2+-binding RTX toxin-like protein
LRVADDQLDGLGTTITGTGAIEVEDIVSTMDLSNLVFASMATVAIDFVNDKAATLGASSGTTITATTQVDDIDTQSGADTVNAGAGGDNISTRAGNDTVFGEAGDDTTDGGDGADTVNGGTGDDMIDLTETTAAADVLIYLQGDGSAVGTLEGQFTGFDVVTGFGATDTVDLTGPTIGAEVFVTESGAETAANDLTDAQFDDVDAVIAL